jgi:hypothetical protein
MGFEAGRQRITPCPTDNKGDAGQARTSSDVSPGEKAMKYRRHLLCHCVPPRYEEADPISLHV